MRPCHHCGTLTPLAACPSCGTRVSSRLPAAWLALGLTLAPGCQKSVALYGVPVSDFDGDGYYDDVDCDDEDPTVHPDAEETPDDGVDSNCDGEDNT